MAMSQATPHGTEPRTRSVTPFDQLSKTRKTELLELCARIGFTPPVAA
jgi:hypothetical protein